MIFTYLAGIINIKDEYYGGMGIVIKKFMAILGFVLALTFLQNVKFEINCLAEEDGMIEWHLYESEEAI